MNYKRYDAVVGLWNQAKAGYCCSIQYPSFRMNYKIYAAVACRDYVIIKLLSSFIK